MSFGNRSICPMTFVVLKAEILDEHGHTVPTANHVVDFEIAGTARIVGVGNGNITSHEENKDTVRKAYNGSCIVIVQTEHRAR